MDDANASPCDPAPARRAFPPPPAVLAGDALAEWQALAPALAEADRIGPEDAGLLAVYCSAVARWRDAEKQIAELGAVMLDAGGRPIRNPYLTVSEKAAATMLKAGGELGLSPMARKRSATLALEDCRQDGLL